MVKIQAPKIITGNRDVDALGRESVCFLKQSAAPRVGVHLSFLLHFYSMIAVIVLSEDVSNSICASLCVYHRVYI